MIAFVFAAALAMAGPLAPPPVPAVIIPGPASGTVLFEALVAMDFAEQRTCDVPHRGIPSARIIAAHARAIPAACAPWWGADESMWYVLLALLGDEGGGHMTKTSPAGEDTFGPYCTSPTECRMTSEEFAWLPCPRSHAAIVERLESDPAWDAYQAAGAIFRSIRSQRGDRLRGIMAYKFGGHGLARAIATYGSLGAVPKTKSFSTALSRILCLRDELRAGGVPCPCACERK